MKVDDPNYMTGGLTRDLPYSDKWIMISDLPF